MTDEDGSSYSTAEISLSRSIRFWLLLIFEIPSLSCSLFILYHFIMDKNLRRCVKTHTIILLNITGFIFKSIDVPLYLHFIRMEKVWPSTKAHCLIWWLVDLGFYYTCCLLAAWLSIERHILIFHHGWLNSQKGRLLAHYIPLITIITYAISYYTWVIFFPPCENIYDYSLPVCGAAPCYLSDPIIGLWEIVVHGCLLTMIIIIFSIGLVMRVIWEKYLHNQPIEWRNHRKMTFQMLSVSSVFIIFNLPIAIMYLAHMFGLPSDVGVQLQLYFFFITYWLLFFLPFVCLNSLPNVKQKLKKLFGFSRRRQATVGISLRTLH